MKRKYLNKLLTTALLLTTTLSPIASPTQSHATTEPVHQLKDLSIATELGATDPNIQDREEDTKNTNSDAKTFKVREEGNDELNENSSKTREKTGDTHIYLPNTFRYAYSGVLTALLLIALYTLITLRS